MKTRSPWWGMLISTISHPITRFALHLIPEFRLVSSFAHKPALFAVTPPLFLTVPYPLPPTLFFLILLVYLFGQGRSFHPVGHLNPLVTDSSVHGATMWCMTPNPALSCHSTDGPLDITTSSSLFSLQHLPDHTIN